MQWFKPTVKSKFPETKNRFLHFLDNKLMHMENQELNNNKEPEQNSGTEEQRNDTTDTGDDTIGENTELTPLAQEVLKDRDATADAKRNQENKDFSEKNG